MIFDLFREGFSYMTVLKIGIRLMIILLFLPVHEYAHGYVAYKLGDRTAKNMGRLTMAIGSSKPQFLNHEDENLPSQNK